MYILIKIKLAENEHEVDCACVGVHLCEQASKRTLGRMRERAVLSPPLSLVKVCDLHAIRVEPHF